MEGCGRLTNSLELTINAEFEREFTGKRTVTPVQWSAAHRAAQIELWLVRAKGTPSAVLAQQLCISERQARRIKSEKVTSERISQFARKEKGGANSQSAMR